VDDRSVSHVYITKRKTPAGRRRYVVRYRWGGRAYKLVHLGSRRLEREARALRDWAAGELAAGRDPRASMQSAAAAASMSPGIVVVDIAWDRFISARLDTSEGTRKNYRKAKDRFSSLIGRRDVHELTVADIQTAVGALTEELEPNTIVKYVNTLRQVLDFADVEPNVARDRRVKLPRVVREEPEPPDAWAVLAMLSKLTKRWRLAFVTAEQTGMRVGEIASVCWRDVDVTGSRFRLRSRETKSRRAKWVPLPGWLMKEIAASCPMEDRLVDRRVFLRVDEDGLRNAMIRACRAAEIVVYSPHDLRHRRISLWHHQGVPTRVIQERVGHARASMTLDTYSHVMPLTEVSKRAFLAALRGNGEVSVRLRA
jgi:integrase